MIFSSGSNHGQDCDTSTCAMCVGSSRLSSILPPDFGPIPYLVNWSLKVALKADAKLLLEDTNSVHYD